MPAVIDIINRSLAHLGSQPLVSLNETSPLAAKIAVLWPGVRDDVLRDHPWKCCQRRVRLPRLADAPAFGFSCQYQLPDDFLRLVDTDPPNARVAVEGRRLLADLHGLQGLSIAYVRREEDAQSYDPQLCAVLALRLAAELAYGITASTSLAQNLAEQAKARMDVAKGTDAREGDPEVLIRPSSWLAARHGT